RVGDHGARHAQLLSPEGSLDVEVEPVTLLWWGGRGRLLRSGAVGALEPLRHLLALRVLLLELEENGARLLEQTLVDVEVDFAELLGVRIGLYGRAPARRGRWRSRGAGRLLCPPLVDFNRDLVLVFSERETVHPVFGGLLLDPPGDRPHRHRRF